MTTLNVKDLWFVAITTVKDQVECGTLKMIVARGNATISILVRKGAVTVNMTLIVRIQDGLFVVMTGAWTKSTFLEISTSIILRHS